MTVPGPNVVRDEGFARREDAMAARVAALRERRAPVAAGGGAAPPQRPRPRGEPPARARRAPRAAPRRG